VLDLYWQESPYRAGKEILLCGNATLLLQQRFIILAAARNPSDFAPHLIALSFWQRRVYGGACIVALAKKHHCCSERNHCCSKRESPQTSLLQQLEETQRLQQKDFNPQ